MREIFSIILNLSPEIIVENAAGSTIGYLIGTFIIFIVGFIFKERIFNIFVWFANKINNTFKSNHDELHRKIGDIYFLLAQNALNSKNIAEHFLILNKYFDIYTKNKIALNHEELCHLAILCSAKEKYQKSIFDSSLLLFFYTLEEYKQYCKNINKQEHLEKTEFFLKFLKKKSEEDSRIFSPLTTGDPL